MVFGNQLKVLILIVTTRTEEKFKKKHQIRLEKGIYTRFGWVNRRILNANPLALQKADLQTPIKLSLRLPTQVILTTRLNQIGVKMSLRIIKIQNSKIPILAQKQCPQLVKHTYFWKKQTKSGPFFFKKQTKTDFCDKTDCCIFFISILQCSHTSLLNDLILWYLDGTLNGNPQMCTFF